MPKETIYGFRNKRIAEKLARMARQTKKAPLTITPVYASPPPTGIHAYICEVKTAVTAAQTFATPTGANIFNTASYPGDGTCYILNRSYLSANNVLDYYEPDGTNKVEVIVYNLLQRPYAVGEKFFAVEDMDGDLWIIGSDTNRRKGVVTETGGINSTGSGDVEIYIGGSASGVTITAYAGWMNKNASGVRQGIAETSEVIVEWFPDENKWYVVAADCLPQ